MFALDQHERFLSPIASFPRAHLRGSREPGGELVELDAGQPQQADVHRAHREIRSLQEPPGDRPLNASSVCEVCATQVVYERGAGSEGEVGQRSTASKDE